MPRKRPRPTRTRLSNHTTIAVMVAVHLGAVVGLVRLVIGPRPMATIALAVVLWAVTGMAITAGYHRLFAHRAYRAAAPVRWLFLLAGAAAFQNSAVAWSADHRDHHVATDGPGDPYSVTRGFWWAHMGWLFRSRPGSAHPLERLKDLSRYPSVRWQHRWYAPIAIVTGLVVPVAVASFWGDPWGGLLIAGALRAAVVLQSTLCVNSVAHWWGRRSYDLAASARDQPLTALITFGEGFHSFHHRFQSDYRNGIRWWDFDPGKWVVWCLARLRLATGLRRTAPDAIARARVG